MVKDENKEIYLEKLEAFKKKYDAAIVALWKKYDKDSGVCYDMLRAIARGNEEYGQGIELDIEELKKDCDELAQYEETLD